MIKHHLKVPPRRLCIAFDLPTKPQHRMPSSDRQRASNHQKSNIHGETQHTILEPNLFSRRLINNRNDIIRSSPHKTVLTSHRPDKIVEKQTSNTATWNYNTAYFALTTTATTTIDD